MVSLYQSTSVPDTTAGLPNASQFGWTTEEFTEYKQLVEYVNEVKAYRDEIFRLTIDIPAYMVEIRKISADIDTKYQDILNSFAAIRPDLIDFEIKYADFLHKYTEVLTFHGEAQASANSAAASATDAFNSKTAAGVSEVNAKASETGALDSYNKSYELYLALQKGMVYRGTWNPNTGAYPSAPDTNSTWDVVLNPNQEEVSFDGKRWFWGDRLLYLFDTKEWTQVEAGTTVKSVNGKVGSVVLSALDTGAIPSTGGDVTGTLVHKVGAGTALNTYLNPADNSPTQTLFKDNYFLLRFGLSDTTKGFQIADYDSPKYTFDRNGQLKFTGNTPVTGSTAHIVHEGGSAAIGTSIITRSMRENPGASWVWEKVNNGSIQYSTGRAGDGEDRITLNVNNGNVRARSISSEGLVYINEGSTSKSSMVVSGSPGYAEVVPKLPSDSDYRWGSALRYYSDGWKVGSSNKIYHQGFKPTADELGVAENIRNEITEINNLGRRSGFFSVKGNTPDWAYGAAGGVMIQTSHGSYLNQLAFRSSAATGLRLRAYDPAKAAWSGWKKVYSEAEKPTPSEIGALSINGGTVSGIIRSTGAIQFQGLEGNTVDANKLVPEIRGQWGYVTAARDSTNMFPVTDNANGILTFNTHSGVFARQIGFSGNGAMYTRFANSSSFVPWRKIFDEGNPPTAYNVRLSQESSSKSFNTKSQMSVEDAINTLRTQNGELLVLIKKLTKEVEDLKSKM